MGIDAIAISAIIIAVVGALGAFVKSAHIQKCKTLCCESDCREKQKPTPPETPIDTEPAIIHLSPNEINV